MFNGPIGPTTLLTTLSSEDNFEGVTIGPVAHSDTGYLLIRFSSDGQGEATGFKITYDSGML